jgi:hypothetical protein
MNGIHALAPPQARLDALSKSLAMHDDKYLAHFR